MNNINALCRKKFFYWKSPYCNSISSEVTNSVEPAVLIREHDRVCPCGLFQKSLNYFMAIFEHLICASTYWMGKLIMRRKNMCDYEEGEFYT